MNIRSISANRLTSDEIAAWSAIQCDNPRLCSPYFRPEFTQAVASVRKDVEVGIFEDAGQPVAFFPYQRMPWNSGRPVAGWLSDFHGVIAQEDFICEPLELLRACRISSWRFDHLVDTRQNFGPYVSREEDSCYSDLSGGFEAYAARLESSSLLSQPRTKLKKLARDIGAVRFEPHVTDRSVLSTMMDWKSEQYRRTGVRDVFAFPWTRELLDKLLDFHGESFSPMMSVLYAGDRIAALHYGLRSGSVLHYWFPVYNQEMARYSPGTLLFLEIFKAAASLGLCHFDWGKGREVYKHNYRTGATRLAEGTVDLRRSTAMVRRALLRTRDQFRSSGLYPRSGVPARMLSRVRSWLELR